MRSIPDDSDALIGSPGKSSHTGRSARHPSLATVDDDEDEEKVPVVAWLRRRFDFFNLKKKKSSLCEP